MIQNLKPEEKEQIHIWLLEAREHAIDGGSSKKSMAGSENIKVVLTIIFQNKAMI